MSLHRFLTLLILVAVLGLIFGQPGSVSGQAGLDPIQDQEPPYPLPEDLPLLPEQYKVTPANHPAERTPIEPAASADTGFTFAEIPLEVRFPRLRFETSSDQELTAESSLIEPNVVGGSEVDPPNSYPWVASLQYYSQHYCGGTLIDPEWVLTAAHCWVDSYGNPYSISPNDTVVLGEHSLSVISGREQVITLDDVYIHPLWNYLTFEYDFALLHLSTPAVIDDYVQPINILDTAAPIDQAAIVAGWGAQYYTGPASDLLLEGQLQILADSACSNYGSFYRPGSMLCAGLPDYSVDACQGDSGGPLFHHDGSDWVQTGVVSWGNECAKEGFPGVYARAALVPDWQFAMEYDCSAQSAIPTSECEALKTLFISTNGTGWTNSSGWLVADDPCTWYGLSCSGGHISAIDLDGNNLIGDFNGDFSGFSSLTRVDLYDNQIYGDLGEVVALLPTGLTELYLGVNQIGGVIPAALLNFSQLEWLNLTDNLITGDIAAAVDNLPANLRGIWLDLNYLTGTIPAAISKFTSLIALELSYNQLSGDWAAIQAALPNGMEWIGLGYTNLSGTIPESLAANHPDLLVLDLAYNYLTGNLPLSLGDLHYLAVLWVNDNLLEGPVPIKYTALPLNSFYFDNTSLCEPYLPSFDTWLAGITYLGRTNTPCMTCSTQTDVPKLECGALVALFESTNGPDWYETHLWGVDPAVCTWYGISCETGHVTEINFRDAFPSGNGLTGTLPVEISDLTELKYFDIYYAQVGGTVPQELFNLKKLEHLSLRANAFSGQLPADTSNLLALTVLNLGRNNFEGPFPTQLLSIPNLTQLWIGENKFYGAIPAEIGNMSQLQSLWLGDNSFTGELPSSMGNLSNLTELYVNFTQLEGAIPETFTSLTLDSFYYDNTSICVPNSPSIQTWLEGIADLSGTGLSCDLTDSIPPMVTILSPSEGGKIHKPKSQVIVDAIDSESGMDRVEFSAYYNDTWNFLNTDNDGSDGWTCVWSTYTVPTGTIKVRAVGYDNYNNPSLPQIVNLQLTKEAVKNAGGYEARAGSSEQPADPVTAPVVLPPAAPDPGPPGNHKPAPRLYLY